MAGPLQSLKILDFTTLLPGPFGTMLMADMGADIIRVESPTRPDLVRFIPPVIDGVSATHRFTGVEPGTHNTEILSELGYSSAAISELNEGK